MKREHYYFDMPKEAYEYIIRSGMLKESRKERTILDLCLIGASLKEICAKTGYSTRTVNYRKKEIYEKIRCLLNYSQKDGDIEKYYENNKKNKLKIYGDEKFIAVPENYSLFKVYLLTFPNEKIYVGITSQEEKNRWRNGNGYIENDDMFNDILKYGWQNIKKNILFKDLTFDEAREKEKELIINYKSHLKKYGYNNNF